MRRLRAQAFDEQLNRNGERVSQRIAEREGGSCRGSRDRHHRQAETEART